MNDENTGAASAAVRSRMPVSRSESRRGTPRTKARNRLAPISASLQLLAYQPSTITVGTPLCNSAAMCPGSAATRSHHQSRRGVSKSAASSNAFGGQSVDIGCV